MKTLKLALLLCLTGAAAQAQTVYRCGADGKTYSQQPCPGGKAVDASDARDAGQRRQSQDAAARDAAEARRLATERREREAHPGANAAGIKPVAVAAAKPLKPRKQKSHGKRRRSASIDDPNLSPPMRAPTKPRP